MTLAKSNAPDLGRLAVCIKPGTELAFEREIECESLLFKRRQGSQVARFRRVNEDREYVHHDALELPSGKLSRDAGRNAEVILGTKIEGKLTPVTIKLSYEQAGALAVLLEPFRKTNPG